jgi:hypothetical protein
MVRVDYLNDDYYEYEAGKYRLIEEGQIRSMLWATR